MSFSALFRRSVWASISVPMAMVLASPLAAQAQATFEKIKHRGWINVGYRVGAAPFSDQDAKRWTGRL